MLPASDRGLGRTSRLEGALRAVVYGVGSDGTVGAVRSSVRIIGERTPLHPQGYFVHDSKKAGTVTVSHLRFGPRPIRSTYLIDRATFVACHQFHLLKRLDVLERAARGATVLLNSPEEFTAGQNRFAALARTDAEAAAALLEEARRDVAGRRRRYERIAGAGPADERAPAE